MGTDRFKLVNLIRDPELGFGFSVIGGLDTNLPPMVRALVKDGPAHLSGKVNVGDCVVFVLDIDIRSFTSKRIVDLLRSCPDQICVVLKGDETVRQAAESYLCHSPVPFSPSADQSSSTIPENMPSSQSAFSPRAAKDLDQSDAFPDPPLEHEVSELNLPLQCRTRSGALGGSRHNTLKTSSRRPSLNQRALSASGSMEHLSHHADPVFIARFQPAQRNLSASHLSKPSDSSGNPAHLPPKECEINISAISHKLFQLNTVPPTEVCRLLSQNTELGRLLAQEYLRNFNFTGLTLDEALRMFFSKMVLIGETQEVERVLIAFSNRFYDCNKPDFGSVDAVHTLTCALMLLNSDLHSAVHTKRMSFLEFSNNLDGLCDGQSYPREILKGLYNSVKKRSFTQPGPSVTTRTTPSTPSRSPQNTAPSPPQEVSKSGFVQMKIITLAGGEAVSAFRRGWRRWFIILSGESLLVFKNDQWHKQTPSTVHSILHCYAHLCPDCSKRKNVFKLSMADESCLLVQTEVIQEVYDWMRAINHSAALLSAPALPAPISSTRQFHRPLLPSKPSTLSPKDQLAQLQKKITEIGQELEEHRLGQATDGQSMSIVANQAWKEKLDFLIFELRRYETYIKCLQSGIGYES